MNLLLEIRARFAAALADMTDDLAPVLDMIRRSQDARFGDYQANCAMPLAKTLGKPSRDVATEIVERLRLDDLCEPPEIAGPGFINLRLREDFLQQLLQQAVLDERLGVAHASPRRTFVIDYSAPNVAKPMHVGHIRSTVIGDALCRTLRFQGHTVVSDNHIGDWGTQFGMIIYGFKHFVDRSAYESDAVHELARLYRLVNQLVDYHRAKAEAPALQQSIGEQEAALTQLGRGVAPEDKAAQKELSKERRKLEDRLKETRDAAEAIEHKIEAVERDPTLADLAHEHSAIGERVLEETARLHEGDEENLRLWREFLPPCLETLNSVYERLSINFDVALGESFYHDRLASVVDDLQSKGLARESDGAMCVFLDGFDTPMIVRKQDGAFLYATTDLATIQYRMSEWSPDAMLYVVDFRQSRHFEQLFATARLWGLHDVELRHISFGTVMGQDKRPYRTRAGDTIGLEGLLNEAVRRAADVVRENSPGLDADEQRNVAETVGIGALKYADLSHNRTSDYVFSYDKMLALSGNTATYLQYAYARVCGIFRNRRRRRGSRAQRRRQDRVGPSGGTRLGDRRAAAVRGAGRRGGRLSAQSTNRVSVRPTGEKLQRLFREVPSAQGGNARLAREPAAAVRFDSQNGQIGPGTAGHRCCRKDVAVAI